MSGGPPPVDVPDIVGKQWSAAKPTLIAAGLDPHEITKFDETHDVGVVLSVNPRAGVGVPAESRIDVTISNGHAPVQVPDVTEKSFDDASQTLTAKHFKVQQGDDEFSNTVPSGKVVRTDPVAGRSLDYGSTVTVFVSKGPDLVTVPDVKNLTLNEATATLHAAGLQVGDITGWNSDKDRVKSQDPAGDKKVVRDSKVKLSFAGKSIIDCILDPLSC